MRRILSRHSLALLFLVAFLVRLGLLVVWNVPARWSLDAEPWGLGHEPLCIAVALAEGRGFADPWGMGTGATGWLGPVYPGLLWLLLEVFGGTVPATAWAMFTLHALAGAVTCVLLVAVGRRLAEPQVGLAAGWIFAFHPAAVWNGEAVLWDTTLVALGVTGFLLHALSLRRPVSPRAALVLGGHLGLLLLLNPVFAAVAVPVVLLLWGRDAFKSARSFAALTTFGLSALVLVAPWMLRNWNVLGSAGLRTNLGVELEVGNNIKANGRPQMGFHPSDNALQLDRYRAEGEVAYSAGAQGRALAWVSENPRTFLAVTARRIIIYWFGEPPPFDRRFENGRSAAEDPKSWLRWLTHAVFGCGACIAVLDFIRRVPRGWVPAGVLALVPLPYYVTHVYERYRFQFEPLLTLLCAWLLVAGLRRFGVISKDGNPMQKSESEAS